MPEHPVTDDPDPHRRVGVVVVAAGAGTRLGAAHEGRPVPKALARLHGEPIVAHAVRGVRACRDVAEIVVVAPEGYAGELRHLLRADEAHPSLTVVAGGAERTDSVAAGLAALGPRVGVVLVHDAARCLTPPPVFDRVIAAVADGAVAVVPGLPVVDTVKVVDEQGWVTDTPARARLRAVQTPQGFRRDVLTRAHAAGVGATDDAALVEALGERVRVVPGDPLAFKVTTPQDLDRALRTLGELTAYPADATGIG